MTASVITIVHCDECKREGPEQIANVAMINWVRMVAREEGWIIKIRHGKKIDICPDCLEAKVTPGQAISVNRGMDV